MLHPGTSAVTVRCPSKLCRCHTRDAASGVKTANTLEAPDAAWPHPSAAEVGRYVLLGTVRVAATSDSASTDGYPAKCCCAVSAAARRNTSVKPPPYDCESQCARYGAAAECG